MQDQHKKTTIAVILAAILMLVAVNVYNPAQFGFKDTTDYDALQRQADAEAKQYRELLASIQPNYAASQQLLQKIATDEIVREEVEKTLQTNQQISIPQIATNELKIANRTDVDYMVNYLSDVRSMVENYNNAIEPTTQQLFAPISDAAALAKAANETAKLVQNLRGMNVPKDAVELHKSELVAYGQYEQVFAEAQKYASNSTSNPWATVYNKYAVIDNRLATTQSELQKISKTYALDTVPLHQKFALIKTAHAQFAVTVVGDIQRAIIEGIKTGLARAFAQFSIQMLDKLVAHIEKNFAIASQLYYSQDLARYYSVEYMKKFVDDPIDQDIIQKFLPEYFCVNASQKELKQIFQAKARENIGNDIVIDPSAPDFLEKLGRLGSDEKNYPQWWEGYYEALAVKTQSEAEAAATKEVLSPGVKTGRDLISGQINKTVSAIFNVQEAAIAGTINLGTNNVDNVVSQMIAGVIQNLVNKFVFTPLGGASSGGISIIPNQNVCLTVPQVKPIIPIGDTTYTPTDGTPPFVAP